MAVVVEAVVLVIEVVVLAVAVVVGRRAARAVPLTMDLCRGTSGRAGLHPNTTEVNALTDTCTLHYNNLHSLRCVWITNARHTWTLVLQ